MERKEFSGIAFSPSNEADQPGSDPALPLSVRLSLTLKEGLKSMEQSAPSCLTDIQVPADSRQACVELCKTEPRQ